jgi:hypothetical protein
MEENIITTTEIVETVCTPAQIQEEINMLNEQLKEMFNSYIEQRNAMRLKVADLENLLITEE